MPTPSAHAFTRAGSYERQLAKKAGEVTLRDNVR